MIETVIEIGTPEQKTQIEWELRLFLSAIESLNLPIDLKKVIVAADMSATVNALCGTSSYRSTRGIASCQVVAMAKIINSAGGTVIVVSPLAFTEPFDSQIRFYLYFHEIIHLVTRRRYPKVPDTPYSLRIYLENIHTLYDEYHSDRSAFHLTEGSFPAPSARWTKYIRDATDGFGTVINDPAWRQFLKWQIGVFRFRLMDADQFLTKMTPAFDTVARSLMHYSAALDHSPSLRESTTRIELPFMDDRTSQLLSYLRGKYEANIWDLSDGLGPIQEFMTHFAVRLSDTPQGLYCEVLSI